MSQAHHHTNRLADETSPYLLQHAHNPVDWHPWGPEAFEIARKEDKPIFLSVGYSTCYWCHVMERQSFENEAIAAEMDRLFVNIKVDREERPDVDQLYMMAVQVLTRQGGWPMSVFLTPQLEPFYGGTYFPPTDMSGRPGFLTLIRALEEAYRQRRQEVQVSSNQLMGVLRQLAEPRRPGKEMTIDAAWVEELLDRVTSDYDPVHGGFGSAPKFPRETELELILTHNVISPNARRMEQLAHTLDAMADGGIRDQLGGGFHRYSTDAHWLVPHFEIMLYDNAMLGWVYAEASRQMNEPRYAKIARGVFDFVLREMTDSSSAFYTAFDAEVDAKEGDNYLWTEEEVEDVLHERGFSDADAKLFAKVYGLDRGPNFADPHHGEGKPEKNILFLPNSLQTVAASIGMDVDALDAKLYPMRTALYGTRLKRKQPLLDTKILTSWNALMIRGLAYGGAVLNERRYIDAAEKGARFLLDHHRDANGKLLRTSRDGSAAKFDAFLDDYAFLADALLALDWARPNGGWRTEAEKLADAMLARFGAVGSACYYTVADASDLIVRQMVGSDSPLPSGNGVAARVLLRIGNFDAARDILAAFAQTLDDHAEGMSALLQAAVMYVRELGAITVSPATGGERPQSPREVAEKAVEIQTAWNGPKELSVELKIADGYHINSSRTTESLIATTIWVSDAVVEYPKAIDRRFEFADEPLAVYEGAVKVKVRFNSPPTESVAVRITYQACSESACLAPMTRTIRVEPHVA